MKYLMTQEEFEAILNDPEPRFTAIYFGATWCGPCRMVDVNALDATPNVSWLKCDIDQNNYTPGFCGVRSIPSFIVVANGKVTGPMQEIDTEAIKDWVEEKRAAWLKNIPPK